MVQKPSTRVTVLFSRVMEQSPRLCTHSPMLCMCFSPPPPPYKSKRRALSLNGHLHNSFLQPCWMNGRPSWLDVQTGCSILSSTEKQKHKAVLADTGCLYSYWPWNIYRVFPERAECSTIAYGERKNIQQLHESMKWNIVLQVPDGSFLCCLEPHGLEQSGGGGGLYSGAR